jgi:hypothetical protein
MPIPVGGIKTYDHRFQPVLLFFPQPMDIKISMLVESFDKNKMIKYGDWCGQARALSHARSSEAAVLSRYMGNSATLDIAIA